MTAIHIYRTDFGTWAFDPADFAQYMTIAAEKAGWRAFRDERFRVAKAVKAWAAEKDRLAYAN